MASKPRPANRRMVVAPKHGERDFADLESHLHHFAVPLGEPHEGSWLAEHPEDGQTFDQYRAANPVRRDPELSTIYLCLIGEFIEPYARLVRDTAAYLSLAFDVPVRVHKGISLNEIPARARRRHPTSGEKQLLTTFITEEILAAHRPDGALAYLGLTTRDLWAGDGWNFVFGQADLRQRVGVYSIARNGYPGPSAEAYSRCLRRTLLIAAHEMGHVLTLQHCTVAKCLMNGCNSQEERDHQPLAPCPVCLRKFCWNLQLEPVPYLRKLEAFCHEHKFGDAGDFDRFAQALEGVT